MKSKRKRDPGSCRRSQPSRKKTGRERERERERDEERGSLGSDMVAR
jgi:hypothetical protein